MAESIEQVCNVCDEQHITKQAVHWCPECEEGLCEDCLKHHNASKYTRSHEVISIENYKLLLPHVDKVIQYCPDHGNKYQVYCPEHECLCCHDCLSPSHDKCAGILSIDKLAKNAKSSTLLSDIERGIQDLKFNLYKISEEKRENISRIMTQRQQISDEIKSFRNKINHQLDIMENEIINDLDAKEKTIKLEIESLMSKLNKKAEQFQNLHDTIRVIKDHGTNLQTFFVSKSLVKSVGTEEIYVKSLFDGNALQQYDLGLVISNHMSDFLCSVKSLGTITCSKSSSAITFHTAKEKEAQMFYHFQLSKSVDEINPKLIREFSVIGEQSEKPWIRGCTVNTDGTIILADSNNKCLVVLNDEGNAMGKISTKTLSPWDVTCIDDSKVVVTCQSSFNILVVNIKTKTIEKIIEANSVCFGIDNREGTLFYYESKIGLQAFNLTTSASSVVIKDETGSSYSRYIAILGERIYLTQYEKDLVLCYSDTGDKIWEYNNSDMLMVPLGVAVDKSSNVYVATNKASVVVVSPDGQKGRKLITLPRSAYAIHIDKNDRLYVVDYCGNASVYTI